MTTDDPSLAGSTILPVQEGLVRLIERLEQMVVGQRTLLDRLVIALLAGGHVLIEGVPGLARPGPCERSRRPSTCRSGGSSSHRTCCPPI